MAAASASRSSTARCSAARDRLAFDEIVLHDVDAERLERMSGVLHGLAAERGAELPFRVTTDLGDAVEGADFVFCAIRVGQLEGRVIDESVPLALDVLGQETTGPGRHLLRAAHDPGDDRAGRDDRRARAAGAWLINFTNPAGMVTEAVRQVLGDRVIGICDTPSALCRRVARALGRDAGRDVVRLLRPQPPRLAAGGLGRRPATGCPSCSPTTRRWPASRRGACSAATGCGRSG